MLRNIGANWILTLATIAVTYVLMPYSLHVLGQEQYGVWILIASITNYIALLVLGVPLASVRFIAQHAHDEDPEALNKTIANCAGIYLILGAVAFVVGGSLFAFFASYDIPPSLWSPARLAFFIVVLNTSIGFIAQLPTAILAAHEQFVLRNTVLLSSLMIRFALTLLLLKLNASLLMLAITLSVCLGFEITANILVLRRKYPQMRLRFSNFDWAGVRSIFGFSLYILVLTVGAQLAFQTDAIVIGKVAAVDQIPFFTTGSQLAIYLMEFIVAIAAVVMPTATRLQRQGKIDELRDVFLKWSKIALSMTLVVGLFLLVLGPQFIGWWVGDEFTAPSGRVLRVLMLGNLIFLPVRGIALPLLMGIGKPRQAAFGFLVAGVLNLVMSILLGRAMGITGVALGTAIPNVLFALFILVLACRELSIDILTYVRYVALRAIPGAIPSLILLYWFAEVLNVHGFFGLFIAGVSMVGVFAMTWIFYVYRGDPYLDLRTLLVARLQQSRT